MDDEKFAEVIGRVLRKRNLDFQLKDVQFSILKDIVVHQRDVLAILPTGYGKTMIYSLLPNVFDECEEVSSSIVIVISHLWP
jgi:superfamily II DNA or RNA helicase